MVRCNLFGHKYSGGYHIHPMGVSRDYKGKIEAMMCASQVCARCGNTTLTMRWQDHREWERRFSLNEMGVTK